MLPNVSPCLTILVPIFRMVRACHEQNVLLNVFFSKTRQIRRGRWPDDSFGSSGLLLRCNTHGCRALFACRRLADWLNLVCFNIPKHDYGCPSNIRNEFTVMLRRPLRQYRSRSCLVLPQRIQLRGTSRRLTSNGSGLVTSPSEANHKEASANTTSPHHLVLQI